MASIPIAMQSWSRLGFILRFRALLRTFPRGAYFHYPLNCLWPLHIGRRDWVSMSVADCTSLPGPFAGKRTSVWAWISFFFVGRIDVLSPAIFSEMRRYRRAERMSLTPGGTYLVPSFPTALPKSPTVVILSRLVPGKGVDHFLDVLPHLWELLCHRAPRGTSFQIAGYGPLEGHVVARVAALSDIGVPIRFVGYAVADVLMAEAAIVLSMQELTNYPSRVVAEALMAGCGVVVRNTGDSREFGDDLPGLLYCHSDLDAGEIAGQIALLLEIVLRDAGSTERIRNAAIARFSSKHYVEYFSGVMLGHKR